MISIELTEDKDVFNINGEIKEGYGLTRKFNVPNADPKVKAKIEKTITRICRNHGVTNQEELEILQKKGMYDLIKKRNARAEPTEDEIEAHDRDEIVWQREKERQEDMNTEELEDTLKPISNHKVSQKGKVKALNTPKKQSKSMVKNKENINVLYYSSEDEAKAKTKHAKEEIAKIEKTMRANSRKAFQKDKGIVSKWANKSAKVLFRSNKKEKHDPYLYKEEAIKMRDYPNEPADFYECPECETCVPSLRAFRNHLKDEHPKLAKKTLVFQVWDGR